MEGRLRLQLIGGIDTRSVAFCIHLCIHLILILIGLPPFREMGGWAVIVQEKPGPILVVGESAWANASDPPLNRLPRSPTIPMEKNRPYRIHGSIVSPSCIAPC